MFIENTQFGAASPTRLNPPVKSIGQSMSQSVIRSIKAALFGQKADMSRRENTSAIAPDCLALSSHNAPLELKSAPPPPAKTPHGEAAVQPSKPRRKYTRRSAGDRLTEALARLSEHHGQILRHDEKPWASITFSGTRHSYSMLFAGDEAVEAGEVFIAQLPEHEFTIAGQLVADANIVSVEQRLTPSPRITLECEILLLRES
jgi:hypothetical protein